jgi:agmatinase
MIPGMYEPADALVSPRFTGPRTFARLPHTDALDGVDCALHGIPWDGGTSFRSGARFGPEGIRSASALLRPYNPAQGEAVFGVLSCVDRGDAPTVPGYIGETLDRIADWVEPIARAGVIPLGMGGDHSVTLGELRGLARVHGPLGLVHLDAHGDLWDRYFGLPLNHGTVFRRALDEELIDPARTLQAGMRGPLYGPEDVELPSTLGVECIPGPALRELSAAELADRVRARVGTGPTFFTFDVDFLDPAVCPATGTPEPGGPSAERALDLVRALQGIDFRGFDVVEVAPQYDGPGQITSLLAANVLYEMLTLVAIAKRG